MAALGSGRSALDARLHLNARVGLPAAAILGAGTCVHELSIAYSIVEAAEEAARRHGAHRVASVQLRVGRLSGVVADALLFGYDVASRGTLLEGSALQIEEVPVVIYCAVCARERTLDGVHPMRCPDCQTPTFDIRAGRELEVTALEIEE